MRGPTSAAARPPASTNITTAAIGTIRTTRPRRRCERVFTEAACSRTRPSCVPHRQLGRRLTALQLPVRIVAAMTMTREAPTLRRPSSEHAGPWCPPARAALPAIVTGGGAVVALRRRRVIAPGGLGVRSDPDARVELDGERLVSAADLAGQRWWIPAAAVWSDGDGTERPEHPRHVGLATDRSWSRAVLVGLSDRLGWEAKQARQRGVTLTWLDDVAAGTMSVWDGRLGHEVPTVLITSDSVERWGAGASVASAYRRAMFGDEGTLDAARELADMESLLGAAGVGVGIVDLATPLMSRAGVARVSVQLLGSTYEPVRRWDGTGIE